jgi:hypothetical protein
MSAFMHLVSASIEEARAANGGRSADDARLLSQIASLLDELRDARGAERGPLVARLRAHQEELAAHLERSGRHLLADAMLHRSLEGELVEP